VRIFIFILVIFSSFKGFSCGDALLRPNKNPIGFISFNSQQTKPNPLWMSFFRKNSNRKKNIATTLAFPLPFGILGFHRLYLGTKPYIPLIYIGTFCGGLGILPAIDFFTLLKSKDISRFENNPRVFMWVDHEDDKKARPVIK
jgi:hypothetical protein